MSSFQEALRSHFPGALTEATYLSSSALALGRLGFHADNTLACVGVCRDEICQPFVRHVQAAWGEAFNLCSLAGFLYAGRTGYGAAMHHSPEPDGRRRYVFFHMAHVALGREGQVGEVQRRGQPGASGACGALLAFHKGSQAGKVATSLDPDDVEMSLLSQTLVERLPGGRATDLLVLTRTVLQVITEQAERLVGATVEPERSDWAVLTGIQVHSPEGVDYVWPARSWAVVRGERTELVLR